jgi:tetratricopeptide (TPR) repeat protein
MPDPTVPDIRPPADPTTPAGDPTTPAGDPTATPADPGTLVQQGVPGHVRAAARPAVPGYELVGELGRGGMGVVYQARHLALNRTVALKMIRGGRDPSPQDLARFRTEAEAVARLQHPGVVQVYEVGEHAGRPYLVLEYVPGGSLRDRLRGTPLPAAGAARVVGAAARAVEAAHARGVLHRDLTPGNVLLTADGEPKLTDFGLAKLLAAGDPGPTQTGAVMGTPSYMAPEQARGDAKSAGPGADVWALGAVLYECLTGRPPFKADTAVDTLLQVTTADPVPPRRLNPKVPRDLDTVCLKCLEKDPARRYPSAGALADDLARFGRGESVRARPVGAVSRGWRWAKRNPATAGLAVAAVALLAGGAAAATALWLRAEANAADARTNLADAREAQGRAETSATEARKNLATAREEQARADGNYTKALEGMNTVTEVARRLRGVPRADGLRRMLLEEVLRFNQGLLAQQADEVSVRREAARAARRMGGVHEELGQGKEAEAAFRQALDLGEKLLADYPNEPTFRADLADTLQFYAYHLDRNSREAEAVAAYRRAIALEQGLAGDRRRVLAIFHNNLGNALSGLDRPAEAEEAYRAALGIWRELARERPDDPEFPHRLGGVLNNLGLRQGEAGKWAEARTLLEEAVGYQQAAIRVRADPDFRQYLGNHQANLGRALGKLGEHDKAEAAYRDAAATRERLAADHPAVPDHHAAAASAQNGLAGQLLRLGKWDDARAAAEAAVRHQKTALGIAARPQYRQSLSGHYWNLSDACLNQGDHAAAAAAARELARASPDRAKEAANAAWLAVSAAAAAERDARLPEADRAARARGYADQARGHLADAERLAKAPADQARLATVLAAAPPPFRDPAKALALATKAAEADPKSAPAAAALGQAEYRAGDWAAAATALERAEALDPGAADGWNWFFLAMARHRLGDREKARAAFDRAVRWAETDQPHNPRLRLLRAEAAAELGVNE